MNNDDKKVKLPLFFDLPEKSTPEETQGIDELLAAVKALPSFFDLPAKCTPEQQKAIDVVRREIRHTADQDETEQPSFESPTPTPKFA